MQWLVFVYPVQRLYLIRSTLDGDQACVGGGFAQCVAGKFVTTSCGALQCVALPLVNKAGTSITCDTVADAEARIAAAGASGGLTGSGAGAAPAATATDGGDDADGCSDDAATATSAAIPAATNVAVAASTGSGFKLQNGKDAQALNAKFATLTADSSCTGEFLFTSYHTVI